MRPIFARQLITEVQSRGLRFADPDAGAPARRGGAGPTDRKAVTVDGRTVLVPVHTGGASESPFFATAPDAGVARRSDGDHEATIRDFGTTAGIGCGPHAEIRR